MSTPQSITLTSAVSAGAAQFASQVDTALSGIGAIVLIGATFKMVESQRELVLLYQTGGQWFNAAAVSVPEGGDLDAAVAAWAVANPTRYVLRLFDMTPIEARRAISDSVLILHSAVPDITRPVVVRNTSGGSIASGATGVVTTLGSAGPTSRIITGVNLSDADWVADREAYAVFDAASNLWLCAPHCC